MRVTTLTGKSTTWSFAGCRVLGDEARPRSSYHKRARALIKALFPHDIVYEEVPLPGTRLRFDFFLAGRKAAVEVQGEQHFAFNAHMHKNNAGFLNSLFRDRDKRRFCAANGISLVELKYSESDDEWAAALQNA